MFFLKAALLVFRSTCRGKRPARKKLGSRMLKQCLFPFIARQGGGLFTLMTHNEANRQFYQKMAGWSLMKGYCVERKCPWKAGAIKP